MRTRARNPFATVTSTGLLLPVDLLTRIVDADSDLPGLAPEDYHLRSGERLSEAASRAWNECLAAWKSFRKKFAKLSASDSGTTLTRDEWPAFTKAILYQLPVPTADELCAPESALRWDFAFLRLLELTYTAWDLEPFAHDCGYAGPPFHWDGERRFLLRCELDAAYFHLYGIARDDVDYILETFPIVKRKDIQRHGDYRTKLTILRLYDALADSIATSRPYQILLTPPPGPPTDSSGNFVPVSQWDSANWPPHVHQPR